MSDITPTVGRHVYLHDSAAKDGSYAAVITEVESGEVLSLHVMTKTGCTPKQGVSRGTEEGQWDWMPYQKEQAAKEDAAKEDAAKEEVEAAPTDSAGLAAASDAPAAGEVTGAGAGEGAVAGGNVATEAPAAGEVAGEATPAPEASQPSA